MTIDRGMVNRDTLALLEIELQKVKSLGGRLSIAVIPDKYEQKALSDKREMDTAVRYGDYIVVGLFGVDADEASSIFLSIPKGIAVFPQDGKDINGLFFEALERLRLKGKSPWVKRLWESVKESKISETNEDLESRFVSASFYQYYAFLGSHPKELCRVFSELGDSDQHWIKDFFNNGLISSLDMDSSAQEADLERVVEDWDYHARMEDKKEQGKKTLRRFRNIEHLFTLPSISQQIIDLAGDSLLAASKMARIIENDPVLTSKLLKVVNSAFYGFHRQINSVEHAVVILGNDEIVNLAFSIALHKIIDNISASQAQSLWEHSLVVAHLCHWLGPLVGCREEDRMFTVGLLHDLGKIVFLQRGLYTGDVNRVSTMDDLAAEESDAGLSHAEMGAYVAERWNLPKSIVEGLLCHHIPGKTKNAERAITVHLSDIISHSGCIDMDQVNHAVARFLKEKRGLSLTQEKITKIYEDTKAKVSILLGE